MESRRHTVKCKQVLDILIYGWKKHGRAYSALELASHFGASRVIIHRRLKLLVRWGYVSNDYSRRPLKDSEGNPMKMLVSFIYPNQKNLPIDLANLPGEQTSTDVQHA